MAGESSNVNTGKAIDYYFDDIRKVGELLDAAQEVELAKRIEAGLAAAAILRLEMNCGVLDASKEELEWLEQDGAEAKAEFIEKNLRFVVNRAQYHRGSVTQSFDMGDIISEGNFGLIRAVEKFDYMKGFKFSTFAKTYIRHAIVRGADDQAKTIRIPVHMVGKINRLSDAQTMFYTENNRLPSLEESATILEITVEKVEEIFKSISREPTSLNKLIAGTESELGDVVLGEDGHYDDEIFAGFSREEVVGAINTVLTDREQILIKRRFGFYGREEDMTDVAKRLGLSRQHIHRLQTAALEKLREALLADKDLASS